MAGRIMRYNPPLPLFDTLEYTKTQDLVVTNPLPFAVKDFKAARNFLKQYDGNHATFNTYRRELERLLQWAWIITQKSIITLQHDDVEDYIKFCLNPPKSWIAVKNVARFITKNGQRMPNPEWRPFVATVGKAMYRKGIRPDKKQYSLSQAAIKDIFKVLSSFYNYLIYENINKINPVVQIRQKSKFLRKQQGKPKIPKLTELQWDNVIEAAEIMAEKEPKKHERTLFIMSALYLMYLRISELVASPRWQPQMGHFYKDSRKNWWFTTVGKGNKERHIAVSDAMLKALKRYRTSKKLKLSPLPSPDEKTPLLYKLKGKDTIASTGHVRLIVQKCFDAAIQRLRDDDFAEEAEELEHATVHWLRHTGISDDINKRGRPIAHVRDDAGHSSSAITDRYNDIELQERHATAKKKTLKSA